MLSQIRIPLSILNPTPICSRRPTNLYSRLEASHRKLHTEVEHNPLSLSNPHFHFIIISAHYMDECHWRRRLNFSLISSLFETLKPGA